MIMKLMLLIETFFVALLAVPSYALTTASSGSGSDHKVLKNPELGSAFRSDTTLRFMRRLHAHEAVESKAEAARTKVCTQHGFKAAERAGCVAFMRQACHGGKQSDVSKESCTHFFQEEQPGYGDEKAKGGQGDLIPDGFQQGPNYNSKKAQAATAKVDDGKVEQQKQPGVLPDSGPDAVPDSMQHGPQYESKRSQKATEKMADKQKKAGPRDGGLDEALKPWGTAATDAGEAVTDAFRDAQKGPNYDKKPVKAEAKVAAKPKPEEPEEPEDKEVPSVPGCKNSPKGWADKKGNDCEDYAEGEWCTRLGGYGDAWLDEWGTFEDVATKGKSAKEACCVCGGGQRKDEESDEKPKKPESVAPASPAAAPPGAAPAISGPILGTKSGRALQEQGYSGDLVAHEDQVTMTEDWGREFGPHAGHRDIKTICAETPGNEWCDLHGYYDKPKSGTTVKSMAAVFAAALFACLR